MINEETFMDLWSLHRNGFSNRAIAKKLGMSRNTVAKYLKSGEMPKYNSETRQSALEPFHQMIEDWLSQDDYSATRIFDMVGLHGYSGSYPTVRRFVNKVKTDNRRRAYVRFETRPGEQAQVDFSDFKVVKTDGTEVTVYCFSMLMGFSRHMYVELVADCQMPTFLDCHQRAFEYFGGVPGEILYDNMKQVVTKHTPGQVQVNATFADFALHYRFKVSACPPYASWVKGKVERPFDYIRERFWRGYAFWGIQQANQDLFKWLESVAKQRIHGTTQAKVIEQFAKEKPYLGELPKRPFDTSEKVVRKVFKDCLVSFQGNRYVVPHHYVGKNVLIKYKSGKLRIYHDDVLLVEYTEAKGRGKLVQDPRFYEALKADQQQSQKKYNTPRKKGKARVPDIQLDVLFTSVEHRQLDHYQSIVGGGICRN